MLNIKNSDLELLEKNHYILDYIEDDFNIKIIDKDGNQAEGIEHVSIVVKDILFELKEEESTYIPIFAIFLTFNYEIICESPLEVISPEGKLVTGGFAHIIAEELRTKLRDRL
jgi:hypothetical protein